MEEGEEGMKAKNLFLNNVVKNTYFILMAFLYTVMSYAYNDVPGDQTAFLKAAQKINYDYIAFAFERYFTWSSRLLIESATAFFASNEQIFYLALFAFTTLFFVVVDKFLKIFIDNQKDMIVYLIPPLFYLFFPPKLYISAGLIATVTNYLFPMVLFVLMLYLILSKRTILEYSLTLLLLVLVIMQEQFAFYSFLLFIYLLVESFILESKIVRRYFLSLMISGVGLLSIKLSPGNAIRLGNEITTWWPEFVDLTLAEKINKGFVATNSILFLNNHYATLTIFLIVMGVFLWNKKRVVSIVLFWLLVSTLSIKIGVESPLSVLLKIAELESSADIGLDPLLSLVPIALYSSFLVILSFGLYYSSDNIKNKVRLFVFTITAYMSRMVMSFSPTLYASSDRTMQPIYLSMFIITLLLLQKLLTQEN